MKKGTKCLIIVIILVFVLGIVYLSCIKPKDEKPEDEEVAKEVTTYELIYDDNGAGHILKKSNSEYIEVYNLGEGDFSVYNVVDNKLYFVKYGSKKVNTVFKYLDLNTQTEIEVLKRKEKDYDSDDGDFDYVDGIVIGNKLYFSSNYINGLNVLDLNSQDFYSYKNIIKGDKNNIGSDILLLDSKGENIYLIQEDRGIFKYNLKSEKNEKILELGYDFNYFDKYVVYVSGEDLNIYNLEKNENKTIKSLNDSNIKYDVYDGKVYYFELDNNAIMEYDIKTGKISKYYNVEYNNNQYFSGFSFHGDGSIYLAFGCVNGFEDKTCKLDDYTIVNKVKDPNYIYQVETIKVKMLDGSTKEFELYD